MLLRITQSQLCLLIILLNIHLQLRLQIITTQLLTQLFLKVLNSCQSSRQRLINFNNNTIHFTTIIVLIRCLYNHA